MRFFSRLVLLLWIVIIFLIAYILVSLWYSTFNINTKNLSARRITLLSMYNSMSKASKHLPTTRPDLVIKDHLQSIPEETLQRLNKKMLRMKSDVVLAVVACGDRLQETLVMIKSAIFFSNNVNLKIIVIADQTLLKGFEEKVNA